jgi:hypothetical protein
MIMHAKQRWPEAVETHLWPFAVQMANDLANFAPTLQKTHQHASPIEGFSQVEVAPRLKHSHTFGSPVYVLSQKLQKGQRVPK